jgi:6-phosphogluconolactonase
MKYFLLAIAFPFLWKQQKEHEQYLIVGTYTGGKSEGIYVFKFNSSDGSFRQISHVKTSNPSFVTVSPDQRYVYAVHENGNNGTGGEVSSYSFNKENGILTLINTQSTQGDHPCYVEVDKTGKWIFAGNYSSGSFSVFPVDPGGQLGTSASHINHEGNGPNKKRQEKPHVHCTKISPDNKYLYVPDLGIDKVMIYQFDEKDGSVKPAAHPFAASAPGSGPRHITFHPNGKFAYLVEELTGHVVVFAIEAGKLKQVQKTSTLPRGQKGYAGSADIHVSPDGKFLYATNRGDFDNIAMFKLDQVTGKASILGFHPTLGKTPRNFNIDPSGNFLLIANQESDAITIFKRNNKTGLLSDTGNKIEVGKPVCIQWINAQ